MHSLHVLVAPQLKDGIFTPNESTTLAMMRVLVGKPWTYSYATSCGFRASAFALLPMAVASPCASMTFRCASERAWSSSNTIFSASCWATCFCSMACWNACGNLTSRTSTSSSTTKFWASLTFSSS